jgi:hypothetical protein
VLWSHIEAHIAIICCSLPTLRPFLRRLLPANLIPSTSSHYRAGNGQQPTPSYRLDDVDAFRKLEPNNTAGTSRERVVDGAA